MQENNWKVGGGVKVRLWCWLLRCVCHIPLHHPGGRKILHRLRKRVRKVKTDVRWFMDPGIQRRDFSSLDFFWFIWKSTLSGWFRGDKRLYLAWSSQQSQSTTSKGATQLKKTTCCKKSARWLGTEEEQGHIWIIYWGLGHRWKIHLGLDLFFACCLLSQKSLLNFSYLSYFILYYVHFQIFCFHCGLR